MDQLSGLKLASITYLGANVGGQFTVTLEAAGTVTPFNLVLPYQAATPFDELLSAQVVNDTTPPYMLPLKITAQIASPGGPNGGPSVVMQNLMVPAIGAQSYTIDVSVTNNFNQSALLRFGFISANRPFPPYTFPIDNLCIWPIAAKAYVGWLCAGQILSDYNTLPEIVAINALTDSYRPTFDRINLALGTGFAAPAPNIADKIDFSVDVVSAAVYRSGELTIRDNWKVADFQESVENQLAGYVGTLGDRGIIVQQPTVHCDNWWELLNCFCRICALRPTLPTEVVSYYDANAAPLVDALYSTAKSVAINEGIVVAYPLFPELQEQCAKLRFILSLFERRCRGRHCIFNTVAANDALLDGKLSQMVPVRDALQIMLDGLGVYICTPKMKALCDKWTSLYDCLFDLCDRRAELPADVQADFDASFRPLAKSLCISLRGICPFVVVNPTACQYLGMVDRYFKSACPLKYLPGYWVRYNNVDALLNQLQSALNTFKGKWGDLCADTITVTPVYCSEWISLISCLRRICAHKYEATAALRAAFTDNFIGRVDDLYDLLLPEGDPGVNDPGPLAMDILCAELAQIAQWFDSFCAGNRAIDPFLKLTLDAMLAQLQGALNNLMLILPELCSSTVSITPSWCTPWELILDCLERFCAMRGQLSPDIIGSVVQNLASQIHYLAWLTNNPTEEYSEEESFQSFFCDDVDALVSFFESICSSGSIDPILKQRLDALLGALQDAYNTYVAPLPGLCSEDTFCEDWAEMLECLRKLCARSGEVSQAIITQFLNSFSSPIDDIFNTIYGYYPGEAQGSLARLCLELEAIEGYILSACGTGGVVTLDQSGEVQIEGGDVTLDATRRAYLEGKLALLMPSFRSLQSQLLSYVIGGGPAICHKIDIDCDKFSRIPAFAQLICCTARPQNFAQLTGIVNLEGWLLQVSGFIDTIALRLGLTPGAIGPASNDICDRLRFVLEVLLLAYANPAALTALQRYQLRYYYSLLSAYMAQYALAVKDQPLACPACTAQCGEWMEMLRCLCMRCAVADLSESSAICAKIDELFTHLTQSGDFSSFLVRQAWMTSPDRIDVNEMTCCEKLGWLLPAMASLCMRCDRGLYDTLSIESYRAPFRAAYDQYMAGIAGAVATCDGDCKKWIEMFECIVKLGLFSRDVPTWLQPQIAGVLSGLVDTVHLQVRAGKPLPDTMPLTNPVTGAFDTIYWKSVEILRGLYWLCSPYNYWSTSARAGLMAQLPAFQTAYNTVTGMLADSWVSVCQRQEDDPCTRLGALPEIYTAFCTTSQLPNATPITVVSQLMTAMASELTGIATQLGLPNNPPAQNASFCVRLRYMLGIVASALSRFDRLARRHQLMVRFIWSVLSYQAGDYRVLLGDRLSVSPSPVREFRRNWLEILACVCATCNRVSTMSAAERAANAAVITALDSVLADIHTLYTTVLAFAATDGMPILPDPCLESGPCAQEDVCGKLRIVLAFFASYCLGCNELSDQTGVDVVTLLAPTLTAVRTKVVLLRGALAQTSLGLCPEQDPGPLLIQSEYLYLQAVGSTVADGSAAGVHLRWSLLGELGAKHLPKGNLAAPNAPYHAAYGFNKPNDFVKIFRTPYKETETYPITLDLLAENPSRVYRLGTSVAWLYEPTSARPTFLAADPIFPAASRASIMIRFADVARYDSVTAGLSPTTNQAHRQLLLSTYNRVIEIETVERPFFRLHLETVASAGTPEAKVEAVSHVQSSNDAGKTLPVITTRRTVSGATGWHNLFVENARFARARFDGCWPKTIRVETYHEYYFAVDRRYGWAHLDDFALSVDDAEVLGRLEDAEHYVIHKQWPKYSDAAPSAANGLEKINVCNYWERWVTWDPNQGPAPYPAASYGCIPHGRRSGDALRDAVLLYLTDSAQTDNWNPTMRRGSVSPGDLTKIEIGVLDALSVVAQDFHVARMLGLATIDWQVPSMAGGASQRYIYVAEYTTAASLESGLVPAGTVHRFLSLPTSQQDHRLPITPQFSATPPAVQFGLETEHPDSTPLTDANGYTSFGDGRFVRLYKAPTVFDLVLEDEAFNVATFFNGAEFSRADNTKPIQFGIRYYKQSGGGFNEVLPQISNDGGEYNEPGYIPFTDTFTGNAAYPNGYPEPFGMLEPAGGKPLFIHHITRPKDPALLAQVQGIHKYGIYSMNWFSRVSPVAIMPDAQAFDTTFPTRNTLMPPSNLRVQYIQKEKPLVLTSQYEQTNIATLGGLTRVLFDWNHIHNAAYQRAKHVDFFFRDTPLTIKGKIKGDPVVIANGAYLRVSVEEYIDYSVKHPAGGRKIIPAMPTTSYATRFVGSVFATPKEKFEVVSATVSTSAIGGDDTRHRVVSFVLKRGFTIEAGGTKRWFEPRKGEYFIAVENMNGDGPWQALPGCSIELKAFDNHIEYESDSSGRQVERTIGGLYRTATIVDLAASDPDAPPGLFRVEFDSDVLPAYNGTVGAHVHQVDWYGGVARIPDAVGTIRMLPVTRIDMASVDTGNKTVIYVFDGQSAAGPSLATGSGVAVNFHPGYRAYLDLPAAGIDPDARIIPPLGEATRNTLMAAWSVDPDHLTPVTNDPYHSALTPAAVHVARRIITLMRPPRPDGGRYATRPNVYGKSSYSFDVTLATVENNQPRRPFGVVFYRASQLDILRALYQPSTVENIVRMLPPREFDEHFEERWRGLVDLEHDAGEKAFRDYGDGIVFPAPDNFEFTATDQQGAVIYPFTLDLPIDDLIPYMENVFDTVLYPLTERPVMVDDIVEDPTLTTSPKPPVLRDTDGQLLDRDDPEYDPTPMIRSKPGSGGNGIVVRFTDYTLDGATSDVYFYSVREVDNTLAGGLVSLMRGPVMLVNAEPPGQPAIQSVDVRLDDAGGVRPAAVLIDIAPYAPEENVSMTRLYRTYDPEAVDSITTMTKVHDLFAEPLVYDLFEDGDLRYDTLIYYRVVALKRIINEFDEEEYVASVPSELIMVNVVDARIPEPPTITASPSSPSGTPPAYSTLTLTWPQTTYKGTYYLYRKDSHDNWVLQDTQKPSDPNATMSKAFSNVSKEDADGNEIFHSFKVVAMNSAGLQSMTEKVLTV